MADLSDVMTALSQQTEACLYPNGTTNPLSPVNGSQTRIFPGWPESDQINKDLTAGNVTVSIYTGRTEKNTTRFLDGFQQVGTSTTLLREIIRATRDFQITVWASTQPKRDSTAAAIKVALSSLRSLPLADGTQAFIRYAREYIDDAPQKELNYQRVLMYEVEYGTFQTETATVVTDLVADVTEVAPGFRTG